MGRPWKDKGHSNCIVMVVVSVVAFSSDDPSTIPATVFVLSVKRAIMNKKEAGVGPKKLTKSAKMIKFDIKTKSNLM